MYAPVAQWIERLASDQKVGSSNLSGRTKLIRLFFRVFGLFIEGSRWQKLGLG